MLRLSEYKGILTRDVREPLEALTCNADDRRIRLCSCRSCQQVPESHQNACYILAVAPKTTGMRASKLESMVATLSPGETGRDGKKRRENENGASSLGGPRRIRSIVARLAPLLLFGCTMRVAADSHAKDNKPRQTLLFPIGKSTSSTVV